MIEQSSSGFVINGLELAGFMRYDVPTPIPFKQKFTVITGPTGSGKTSILDSITYALYGRSSRTDEKMKIEEFVSDDGYVQLDFVQDGQDYKVIRGRKNGRNYLILSRGSQRISGTTTEVEQRIVNLVGLDYTGFINSTFIRQDEMKQLGLETGAGRLDIFERLFRLEIFERAQDLADKKLRATENEMGTSSEELREKRVEYEVTLPEERRQLLDATNNYNRVKKILDNLETEIKQCKDTVAGLDFVHKEYEKSVQRISEINDEIEKANSELEETVTKDEKRVKLRDKLSSLRGAPDKEKELMEKINELEKVQEKVSNLFDKTRIHQQAIERIKKETSDEISEVKIEEEEQRDRLKRFADVMTREEALDLLRLDGALRERLERIAKEIQWLKEFSPKLVESLKSERKKTDLQSSKVISQVKKIGADPFVRGEIESSLKKLAERIQKLADRSKAKIQHEQNEIEPLEEELKKLHFDDKDSARLEDLRDQLKKVKKSVKEYNSLNEELENLPDQSSLIASLKKAITKKGEELRNFSEREKKLLGDEEDYQAKSHELEELREKHSKLQKDLGQAERETELRQNRVSELEKLSPRIEELKKALEDFERKKQVFTILKQEIFHRKGILVFAINQLLQGISIEASQILGDLTDQRLNNIRITPTTETRGGSVLIEAEGVDGLFHDVSTFSGGEKTQINGALRFAIAKELSRMPQVGTSYGNMKTLFIDEGDLGSLDTESSRIYFVRKLMNLGEFFERIILITHITEVAEQFPNRIRVYMTPERNSRVDLGGISA